MDKNSPNLKVVSSTGSDSERRRVPRLNVTTEQFRMSGPKGDGKIYSVVDLSTGGMSLRLLDSADLAQFSLAQVIEGTINLRREKFPIKARVRWLKNDAIGAEFENMESKTIQALKDFFDPEALGQELRPVPAQEEGALWYHGPSGTDLLFWRKPDGSYHRFAIFLMGSYAQWDEQSGLATGRSQSALEKSETQGYLRLETMLLSPDPQLDSGKLDIAKTLILSSNLPQDLKRWCVRQLTPT
jgi:hypothetical protein